MSKPVKIDPEIHQLIPALTEVEYQQLKVNLLDDGCLDALIVWDEQDILLDGHNRLTICQDHKLPYDVTRLSFPDRGSAIDWVINHQLGRRNLTPMQVDYLRGSRYLNEKHELGANQHTIARVDNNCPPSNTHDRLAAEYNVHPNTIKNNAKFAAAVNVIENATDNGIKDAILSGDMDTTKQEVIQFAAVLTDEPEVGQRAIDELNSGNATSFKQAIQVARDFNYKRDNRINHAPNEYIPQGYDACQTPPYAIDPLLPYLNPKWTIWEPACGEGLLVEAFYDSGFKDVVVSDILTGQNFFEYEPPDGFNCLITNPPYSLKYRWLERCYELGKPFALLLPVETLGAKQAQELMQKHGFSIMLLNRRVSFKMPNKGWAGGGAQFSTMWFCWNLLPEAVMFGEIIPEGNNETD